MCAILNNLTPVFAVDFDYNNHNMILPVVSQQFEFLSQFEFLITSCGYLKIRVLIQVLDHFLAELQQFIFDTVTTTVTIQTTFDFDLELSS